MTTGRQLASERELANAPCQALTYATARFELRLDAVRVLLAALGFVDGVLRIVDDTLQAQRGTAVLIDLAVKEVPTGFAFFSVSASDVPPLYFRGTSMCVSLGVVISGIVRWACHRDVPRSVELGLLRLRGSGSYCDSNE
jgi:hypothetical protein